jgi:cysteine desulfurase / selenocysteine lyase
MSNKYKSDFPIFKSNPDLVYLDSGATTHKPQFVIDCMTDMYQNSYGTVHRGIYDLSVKATQAYNNARKAVQQYINASSDTNIIFTRGTTSSINLAAFGYAQHNLTQGDEILITEIEHHANFVPWQQLAKQVGAVVKYAPIEDDGSFDLDKFTALITPKTKVIAVTHISNVLGTILPVADIVNMAKEKGIVTLIDGAQAVAHQSLDIQALDPDFYCFSGHKMYGPTGIGVLYASERVINAMQPITFGGDMIESVAKEGTTFAQPPLCFEAGTPPIVEAIGLHAAIEYIQRVGLDTIHNIESELTDIALEAFDNFGGLDIIGRAKNRSSAIAFNLRGVHAHDLGTVLDNEGVAVRVGHHCAQPTMARFNVPATARVSFGIYSTKDDINACMAALQSAKALFGV